MLRQLVVDCRESRCYGKSKSIVCPGWQADDLGFLPGFVVSMSMKMYKHEKGSRPSAESGRLTFKRKGLSGTYGVQYGQRVHGNRAGGGWWVVERRQVKLAGGEAGEGCLQAVGWVRMSD